MNEDKYCQHQSCKLDTEAELAALYTATKRASLIDAMMRAREPGSEVRCRHVPRRGRVNAPLPERR